MAIGSLVAFADPVRAGTNIAAWNLINQVNSLNREISIRQLRLATGKQQPRMEDGASFFVVWNKMRNQVRGKEMALDNIGDAKDELSLAEAGLLRIDELLSRMRDIVVRASNDTLTDEQRDDIKGELSMLYMAITDAVARTRFNEGGEGEDALLDGFKHTYQVGPNETELDKFTVEIPNILMAVTKAIAPELGAKMESFFQILSSTSPSTQENISNEIRSFADSLPEGKVRKAIFELAGSVKPNSLPADFLAALMHLDSEESAEFDRQLNNLFNTRLSTTASQGNSNFQADSAVAQQFLNLAPQISELIGNPDALDVLAAGIDRIANSSDVENPGFINSLLAVKDAISSINEPYKIASKDLEGLISTDLGPDQRLSLGQDLVFFASAVPGVANRPNVQSAMNQLALDIVNNVDGMPNFTAAVGSLNAEERAVLQAALNEVSTDPSNGLSFHIAVPDLDGPGGPFSLGSNTFAQLAVRIPEGGVAVDVATVFQNAANNLANQFPGVTSRLNNVISLLSDGSDLNDAALSQAVTDLGTQIENDTREDGNLVTVFQVAANNLATQFPNVTSSLNSIIALLGDGDDSNDQALGEAFRTLGAQIETASGGFFFDPNVRATIQQAFITAANTGAFSNLSQPLQQSYAEMVGDLASSTDLNGFFRGPFSPNSSNSFANAVVGIAESDPTQSANIAARETIQQAFLAAANSEEFSKAPQDVQDAYAFMVNSLTTFAQLTVPGAPFSSTDGTLGKALTDILEGDAPISANSNNAPLLPTDAENLSLILQSAASAISATHPNAASQINTVVGLLNDSDDTNDNQLANALIQLGALIEADTGGSQEINGVKRAELRRVLLDLAGTQAFDNLSLTMKAGYLQMAESLGAYTSDQISELDAKLEAVANTFTTNPTNLANALTNLTDQLSNNAVTGAEREALVTGLAEIAKALGSVIGNEEKLTALQNSIDDPSNDNQANPNDLVGTLGLHLTNDQSQAFQDALTTLTSGIGLGASFNDFLMIENSTDGSNLLAGIDDAIDAIKDTLIDLGGVQTKLTGMENILSTSIVAEDSVASRFGDADLAKEQVELTKLQLFSQLATAQSAAANALPGQIIGGLLGGR